MMVMDHALSEAMQEIEELYKHYDEQEQVIKDCDDFIVDLLAKIDSEDSDSDPNLNYNGDDDGGATRTRRWIRRRSPMVTPLRSRSPNRSLMQSLRRFLRGKCRTRWSSCSRRPNRRSYPRPHQHQHYQDHHPFLSTSS
jgi:hypothetical protein